MAISTLFTFQIIGLAIGFIGAYWLLVTADSQDERLKRIGETLGWTLIVATVILAICNLFYSIAIANNYTKEDYYPINSPVQQQQPQQTTPAVQEAQDMPENPAQGVQGGGTPVKSDIHDHE